MGLVGLFAYLYRERREQGVQLEAHAPTLERDLLFFLAFFAVAGALSWGPPGPLRIAVGVVFLVSYLVYVAVHPGGGRRGAGRGDPRPAAVRPPLERARRTRRSRSASSSCCSASG